ncbi:hypothetical protein HYX06_05550 [Candidatus Woesearchaeota archaeon]|nr:hypothetical protein [Candidatus Woesearchaeota archaeon]
MAETNPLAVPGEQKKEKGTLESVVDEIWDFGKKTIAIGAVAAMPFLYNFYDPSHVARAAVTTYGFAAAKSTANVIQNKKPLEGIVWQGATGNMLSYPLARGFTGLNNLETALAPDYGATTARVAKAGGMVFGLQPAFTTIRTALNYGVGKKFRENLWPGINNTLKYISLIGAANVLWIYQYGLLAQMATSMLGSYVINLVESLRGGKGHINNLFSALNPFSYIGAAAGVSYKLAKNTIGGIYTGLHDVGKSIGDAFGGSYQPSAPSQPSPARPAPSPAAAHPAPAH